MTYVIVSELVASSLSRLRQLRVHPLFAGYLHLLQRAGQTKKLQDLQPDFLSFFKRYFEVADHPLGTPYIRPFTERTASTKNLWLNENVAGSYAPSSLRPDQPFRAVVEVKDGRYALPSDHAPAALKHLLFGEKLPVVDVAVFMLRDFGIVSGAATVEDLVDAFAWQFGLSKNPGGDVTNAFGTLFTMTGIAVQQSWLIPFETPAAVPSDKTGIVTSDTVRRLSAAELVGSKHIEKRPRPTVNRLKIVGLLSFKEETSFEFGQLNVLVGANGSGKSNLLDCLRLIAGAPRDIQTAFGSGGFESWLNNALDKSSGVGEIELVVSLDTGQRVTHGLRFGPPIRSRAQIEEAISLSHNADEPEPLFTGSYRSEPLIWAAASPKRRKKRRLGDDEYNPFRSVLGQIRDLSQYPEISRLAQFYSSIRVYSEWSVGRASKLRESAPAGRTDTRLSESMDDLPVALNAVEGTPSHERILQLLPKLKDTYRDFVTRSVFGRVAVELIESGYSTPIPAMRLSDGTLRFLALAAIVFQPVPPPLICIEEPELGMHPDAVRMVAEMISELSQRTQVVVTTHSDLLLTALQDEVDAVFAFDSGLDGSNVRRFSRADFQEWKSTHSLGELWVSGELGGNRW